MPFLSMLHNTNKNQKSLYYIDISFMIGLVSQVDAERTSFELKSHLFQCQWSGWPPSLWGTTSTPASQTSGATGSSCGRWSPLGPPPTQGYRRRDSSPSWWRATGWTNPDTALRTCKYYHSSKFKSRRIYKILLEGFILDFIFLFDNVTDLCPISWELFIYEQKP